MVLDEGDAASRDVKNGHHDESDQEMESETEQGRGGAALEGPRAEQTAGHKLQEASSGRSSQNRDDKGRGDVHCTHDQPGDRNNSEGAAHAATLGRNAIARQAIAINISD